MKNIIKLISVTTLLAIALTSSLSWAAGGGGSIYKMHVDVHQQKSLQRGAKYFMNYCLSCHAASYSRYNRVAADLGISEQNMRDHLIFTGRKFGDTMTVALTPEQGKEWFGAPPPDLSVRARSRGADWIYSFLKTFYLDESATRGVNNLQFPGTSMPHVLWELQGLQVLAKDDHDEANDGHSEGGHGAHKEQLFEIVEPGKMTEEEYDQAIVDIVNFMVYMAEPIKLKRQAIGVGVLFFLAALGVLVYFMKRDYWKDVH